jgi:hypothetical protein
MPIEVIVGVSHELLSEQKIPMIAYLVCDVASPNHIQSKVLECRRHIASLSVPFYSSSLSTLETDTKRLIYSGYRIRASSCSLPPVESSIKLITASTLKELASQLPSTCDAKQVSKSISPRAASSSQMDSLSRSQLSRFCAKLHCAVPSKEYMANLPESLCFVDEARLTPAHWKLIFNAVPSCVSK